MVNMATTKADDMRKRILDLEGLPPFPAAASKILMECQKPDVDARAVAQLVECEPAVSAKVIELANSPLFGAPRPIASINHAIVLLGFSTVSQLALSIAAGTMFEQGDQSLALHRKKTFRQSLACAISSRMLATKIGSASPDEAFLCGVMHDVGKLVLFDAAADDYCKMLDQEPSLGDTTAAEQEAFGVDHAGVGKRCGTKWGFPTQINTAIEQHHKSFSEISHELSKAVMVGNYFSRRWSLADPETTQPPISDIDDRFNADDLASMRDECIDQFDSVIEVCTA